MSKLPSRRQIPDNPLVVVSDSKYGCCFAGCQQIGVWSPTLVGPGPWFCRTHAGMSEPERRKPLSSSQTIGLMQSIFGRSYDREADEERAAIQAEGNL